MIEVRDKNEALYLACEMEKRAVDMYERAQILFIGTSLAPMIEELIADERRHLDTFGKMWEEGAALSAERKLLLAAHAGEMLFSGGLMQAKREGAFDDPLALLRYAYDWETDATRRYEAYAALYAADEGVSTVFRTIAGEERVHQTELTDHINKLEMNQSPE